jgi:hypothetical protein
LSRLRAWAVLVPVGLAIAAPALAAAPKHPPSKLWSQFPLGQTLPQPKPEAGPTVEPHQRPATARPTASQPATSGRTNDQRRTLALVLAVIGTAAVLLLLLAREGSRAVLLAPRLTTKWKGGRHMHRHRLRRGARQSAEPSLTKLLRPPRDPQPLADTLDPYSLRERIEPVTKFSPDPSEQPAVEAVNAGEGASTFAEVGSRVAGVLEAAEAAAQKLVDDAQAEAQRLRQRAAEEIESERARAEQLRQEAETYVAGIREEAERMLDERRQTAEVEATKIRSEAEAEARALRESGEQLYARSQAKGLERRQQLEATARELEVWLHNALGTMHDAASRLEGALRPTQEPEPEEAERPEMATAGRSE